MGDPLKISRAMAPYKMAEMHGRSGGGHTGPCRDMVLVERSLLPRFITFLTKNKIEQNFRGQTNI